jgi:hypothetical protein
MTEAYTVFQGSDAVATKRYLRNLEEHGPIGVIASNLFRGQKASDRAKKYRGGVGGGDSFIRYRDLAYERKGAALASLTSALLKHAYDLELGWGWGRDTKQAFNIWVIYVDLRREGQVSFHSPVRGEGPEYSKVWDGLHSSGERILRFCDRVMTMEMVREKQEKLLL